jgi:hypothetical protein
MLAKQGEKKVGLVNTAANPFSKGTGVIDMNYRVGDRYVFRSIDLLTKIENAQGGQHRQRDHRGQVIYNNGAIVTDLLGNHHQAPDGTSFSPSQMFIGEYSLGKKWTTRYAIHFAKGGEDTIELDLKVVGKETITVPAGTFDCFKVEARLGARDFASRWNGPSGSRRTRSIAIVAMEAWWRKGTHHPLRTPGIGGLHPRRLNQEAQQFRPQPHRARQPQRHAHRQRHRKEAPRAGRASSASRRRSTRRGCRRSGTPGRRGSAPSRAAARSPACRAPGTPSAATAPCAGCRTGSARRAPTGSPSHHDVTGISSQC